MKLTCLSKGMGFHFPPCHIFNICGFQILLDCPLDLSSLTIFSPIPTDSCTLPDDETSNCSNDLESMDRKRQKIEKPLNANDLIKAEPWFKTVTNLHLWDISFIDIVLISSPEGLLGLPFLTRTKGFSAKVYVTEATSRIGQLMMEDLISMQQEFRQFYGPEGSCFPQWMKWEELEVLPSSLRERALGKDGSELGGWMPLYSAADVKDCIQKVQALKYSEETCYNGALVISAASSGLEIGTCNWLINSPKGNIACLSSSILVSALAMSFDYHAVQGNDLILYSDVSFLNVSGGIGDDENCAACNNFSNLSVDTDDMEALNEFLLGTDDSLEEIEKLAFICSCIIESIKAGGSVVIPIGRLGIVLQLLELISISLESSHLKVPMFIISSVAEELLAYTNVIPEWLCKQRQEKLYSGEPLFAHVELIKEKRLHLFPAVHSPKLLTLWQEPCIVFSPHWSLRLGPAVHLLRHWCGDHNSLLVMEEGVDADLALLPFKPMAMKVLQCSFLSGIKLHKVQPLLKILQMPEDLGQRIGISSTNAFSLLCFSENETLRIPRLKDTAELEIAAELASQFNWRRLKGESTNITRLMGDLFIDHGKYRLVPGNLAGSSGSKPLIHWGSLGSKRLLLALEKMGIRGSVNPGFGEAGSDSACIIHVHEPKKATIEIQETRTIISAADENFASLIFEAVDGVLNGI
ncbi:uncharacterized protein LOC131163841 isoform X2 [Malania oleifera]|uniref:uncharacterized protein LOC131163841 isoform X2 n=1 Tax=Malania oleifera TaxID=397392 RepID=UPI0025AE2610|nr:uncharacterized protein LOC131163841 isoform X2 [Malania oleifera]